MNNTNVWYYIFLQVLNLVYELPEDGISLPTHERIVTDYTDILFFFISNLIHCFSVYIQYLLSSFLYMFQASQTHHQEV